MALLRLSLDGRCLKYEVKEKIYGEEGGGREAVGAEKSVICSQFVLRWWSRGRQSKKKRKENMNMPSNVRYPRQFPKSNACHGE